MSDLKISWERSDLEKLFYNIIRNVVYTGKVMVKGGKRKRNKF